MPTPVEVSYEFPFVAPLSPDVPGFFRPGDALHDLLIDDQGCRYERLRFARPPTARTLRKWVDSRTEVLTGVPLSADQRRRIYQTVVRNRFSSLAPRQINLHALRRPWVCHVDCRWYGPRHAIEGSTVYGVEVGGKRVPGIQAIVEAINRELPRRYQLPLPDPDALNKAWALGQTRDPRRTGRLIAALHDHNLLIRDNAASALGAVGEPSVKPLLVALKDKDPEVRFRAASALGQTGDKRALRPLVARLKDYDALVRAHAAWALEEMGDRRASEALIDALEDTDPFVRRCAASALAKLRVRNARAIGLYIARLNDRDGSTQEAAIAQLVLVGKPAVPRLLAALKDQREPVRMNSAKALGRIGDRRAVRPLMLSLKDRDKGVRSSAVMALGDLEDPRAIQPLGAILRHDSDFSARSRAAEALGQIGKPAVPTLISALRDRESQNVRMHAADGLGMAEDRRAVEPLIAALKDPWPYVRGHAAWALGKIGDARAVGPLTVSLKDADSIVREFAARGLGEMKSARAVEALIAALRDKSPYVRGYAASALGQIGDTRAVTSLIAALGTEPGIAKTKGDAKFVLFRIARALKAITGQNLGTDAAKWQRWWNKQEGKPKLTAPSR